MISVEKTGIIPSAKIHSPVRIRAPRKRDGAKVWHLVNDLKVLDSNSMYCNLLQCTHFAETCAIAEMNGECVGWVSGYLPPPKSHTLFIWQVAVSAAVRGRGIGKRLIREVLERDGCRDVRQIDATITADKPASWALFGSIAKSLNAPIKHTAHFERETHLDGAYPTEYLVSVGPFDRMAWRKAA